MNHFTGSKQMPDQTLTELKLSRIKLLTHKEAAKLLDMAYQLNKAYPQLRVGQNLINFLHEDYPDLANKFHGGPADFFYENDVPTVIETFYKYYVEK